MFVFQAALTTYASTIMNFGTTWTTSNSRLCLHIGFFSSSDIFLLCNGMFIV